jgi:regulator of RNase E activity RraA
MSNVKINLAHLSYGHVPVVRPKIVVNVPRLSSQLVERFHHFYVPDISDAVGPLYTMESSIRPIYQPMKRLNGIALTVKTPPGDTSTIQRVLQMVQPGDVLVIDARGYTECCGSGTGSLIPAIHRGLRGVVIDGAWRDVNELHALGFPLFSKGISAYSGPKCRPGEINVPVCCGGVIVHPGDIVVCDEEGCTVVPQEEAGAVADALKQYTFRPALQDWDAEEIDQRKKQVNSQYFEEVFKARGGIMRDYSDNQR